MKTALALTGFTVIWLAAWWAFRRDHTARTTKLQRTLDEHRACEAALDAWQARQDYDADLKTILDRCHAQGLRLANPGEPVPDPAGADGEPGDLYGPAGDDDDD